MLPYFALIDFDMAQKKVERQEIITNPRKDLMTERGKGFGLKLAQFLISYKPDIIVTREDLTGKCAGYVFAESCVETQKMSSNFFMNGSTFYFLNLNRFYSILGLEIIKLLII